MGLYFIYIIILLSVSLFTRPGIVLAYILVFQATNNALFSELNLINFKDVFVFVLLPLLLSIHFNFSIFLRNIIYFLKNKVTFGLFIIVLYMLFQSIFDKSAHLLGVVNRFVPILFLLIVASISFKNKKFINDFVFGILIFGFLAFSFMYLFKDLGLSIINDRSFVLSATGLDPITFGRFSGIVFIVSGFFTLYTNNAALRLFSVFNMLLALFCIMASGTKGVMVAVIFSIAFFITFHYNFKKGLLVVVFSILAVFLAILLFNFENTNLFVSFIKLKETGISYNTSAGARYLYLLNVIQILPDNFLLGLGTSGFLLEFSDYPHNMLLELIIDYGILGLLSLILILFTNFKFSYNILKAKHFNYQYYCIIVIWLFLFIHTMFSGDITRNTLFWVFTGVMISTQRLLTDRSLGNRSTKFKRHPFK